MGIVDRLRERDDSVVDEAAEMLEWLLSNFQMHSPHMGGQHRYRFRNGGWVMSNCVGPNIEDALSNALAALREQNGEGEA